MASRRSYYMDRINAVDGDPRRRWAVIRDVLHQTESSEVMAQNECQRLCGSFADYFASEIRNIKIAISLQLSTNTEAIDTLQSDMRHSGPPLFDLLPPTDDEVSKLIRAMPAKSSVIDSIPTSVIKSSVDIFAKLIARLATLSFNEGCFPARFKIASVTPLLKKKGLDRDDSSSYRPISNLHTISKILERHMMLMLVKHVERSPSYN